MAPSIRLAESHFIRSKSRRFISAAPAGWNVTCNGLDLISSESVAWQVGNKTDLAEKRKVSREEGEEKARKYKILYVETRCVSNVLKVLCVLRMVTLVAWAGQRQGGAERQVSIPHTRPTASRCFAFHLTQSRIVVWSSPSQHTTLPSPRPALPDSTFSWQAQTAQLRQLQGTSNWWRYAPLLGSQRCS